MRAVWKLDNSLLFQVLSLDQGKKLNRRGSIVADLAPKASDGSNNVLDVSHHRLF